MLILSIKPLALRLTQIGDICNYQKVIFMRCGQALMLDTLNVFSRESMFYTNAQFRSILNGLGFKEQGNNEPDFPLSNNNASLTDDATVQAIEQFQTYFHLVSDGIAGSQTMATAERKMSMIHTQLNQVFGTHIPDNYLFYNTLTIEAIQRFQTEYNFAIDGIASLPIRQQLYLLAHPDTTREQLETLPV